jgi:hypothetical protein
MLPIVNVFFPHSDVVLKVSCNNPSLRVTCFGYHLGHSAINLLFRMTDAS